MRSPAPEKALPDLTDRKMSAALSRLLGFEARAMVMRERWAHEGLVGLIATFRADGRLIITEALKLKAEEWPGARLYAAAQLAVMCLRERYIA